MAAVCPSGLPGESKFTVIVGINGHCFCFTPVLKFGARKSPLAVATGRRALKSA
jgi:hypothetical protein